MLMVEVVHVATVDIRGMCASGDGDIIQSCQSPSPHLIARDRNINLFTFDQPNVLIIGHW